MDRLQQRQKEILDILAESSGWVSRRDIARKLNRHQLNPTDLSALAALEATQRVEVDRRDDTRPAGVVFYYRLVAADHVSSPK